MKEYFYNVLTGEVTDKRLLTSDYEWKGKLEVRKGNLDIITETYENINDKEVIYVDFSYPVFYFKKLVSPFELIHEERVDHLNKTGIGWSVFFELKTVKVPKYLYKKLIKNVKKVNYGKEVE